MIDMIGDRMKRVLRLSVIIIMMALITMKVDAIELCSKKEKSKLRTKAYSVTLGYTFHNEDELFEKGEQPYFEILISNIPEGIEVKAGGYTLVHDKTRITYSIKELAINGLTFEAKVYSAKNNTCGGELFATKKINLPKYNPYSRRDECIEYEEFEMCNMWYKGTIENEGEFNKALNEYIESLKPKEEEVQKENKNIFEKIIDFYLNNKIVTVPLTVIAVLGIGYVVVIKIIKRKKRVKIDF